MNAYRRAPRAWLFLMTMLLATTGAVRVSAQDSGTKVAVPTAGSTLPPADRSSVVLLRRAEECIRGRQYANAVALLQSLIEQPGDGFYFADDDRRLLRSLKRRAEALLLALPPDGQVAYDVAFGGTAKQQFDAAIEDHDESLIRDVMRHYFATKAGLDATYVLAMHEFDRGEFLTAASLLSRLKRRTDHANYFEPNLSLRMAAAWAASGFPDRARNTLNLLKTQRAAGQTRIGNRLLAFSDLQLANLVRAKTRDPQFNDTELANWKMLRGNSTRNPVTTWRSSSAVSADSETWSRTTLNLPRKLPKPGTSAVGGSKVAGGSKEASDQLKSLSEGYLKKFLGYQKRVFSARSPIVVGNTVLARSFGRLAGFDLRTGADQWASPTDRTLEMILGDGQFAMNGLLNVFTYQRLWTDKTAAGLVSDGRFVFAIENEGLASPVLGMIRSTNSLTAYHAPGTKGNGRIAWTLGGRLRPAVPRVPMRGTFLLGPPLAVGGKLYCIAESEGEIRLLVVDSNRLAVEGLPKSVVTARNRLVWHATLAQASQSISADLRRRILGTTPAESGGMIVCPTGEGMCVAVDLFQQRAAWAFDARPTSRPSPEGSRRPTQTNTSQWLGDSTVTVVDDRILFSPANPPAIFCLNRDDGSLLWESRRDFRDQAKPPNERHDSGVYLAGAWNGRIAVVEHAMIRTGFFRVLVVSSAVRILDLQTGKKLHSVRIDKPSGYGVIVDGVLYQPTAKQRIAKVDLSNGSASTVSTPHGRTFVNLICVRGQIIAQSPEWLDVFPISTLIRK